MYELKCPSPCVFANTCKSNLSFSPKWTFISSVHFSLRAVIHHLAFFGDWRRIAQLISGRISSQVTARPVAFSISGQRSAGTWRRPRAHIEMNSGRTFIMDAISAALPRLAFT